MVLNKEQKEEQQFQRQKQKDRLEGKMREIKARYHRRPLCQSSLERLAKTLLEIDDMPKTAAYEEFAGEHDLHLRIEQERMDFAQQLDVSIVQKAQDIRVEELCQQILDANPLLRQKEAQKKAITTDPTSIDYRYPKNHLRTQLHQAVYESDLAEVMRLVEVAGANTDIKDAGDNTPFGLAIREEYIDIAEYLKDK